MSVSKPKVVLHRYGSGKVYQVKSNVKWLGWDRFKKYIVGARHITKEKTEDSGSVTEHYFAFMKFYVYDGRIIECGTFKLPVVDLRYVDYALNADATFLLVGSCEKEYDEYEISELNVETGTIHSYHLDRRVPSSNPYAPVSFLRRFRLLYVESCGWVCITENSNVDHCGLYSIDFDNVRNEANLHFTYQLPVAFFSYNNTSVVADRIYTFSDTNLHIYDASEKTLSSFTFVGDLEVHNDMSLSLFLFQNNLCTVCSSEKGNESQFEISQINFTESNTWFIVQCDIKFPSIFISDFFFPQLIAPLSYRDVVILPLIIDSTEYGQHQNLNYLCIVFRLPVVVSLKDSAFTTYWRSYSGISEKHFIDECRFHTNLSREYFGPSWTICDKNELESLDY